MPDLSIGIDLGGTDLRVAAVSAGGRMLEKIALSTRIDLGCDHVGLARCATPFFASRLSIAAAARSRARHRAIAAALSAMPRLAVKDDDEETAIDCVKNLVEKHGTYASGERTPGGDNQAG